MFEKLWMMPLFNEDGGAEGGDSAPVETAVPTTETTPTSQPFKPLMDFNPLLQDAPTETPVIPKAPAEELDFSGRKVQVVDPVIRDIHKDYSSLQKTYNETNMSMKALQEQNQTYLNMIQSFQQQGVQAQTQAPVVETSEFTGPTPEDNETFMNQFYDNALGTIDQRIEAAVKARLEAALQPIQQEREQIQREKQVNTEVQTLTEKYADFQDHVDSMQEILRTNPQLADQGLETVYFVARGQQAGKQTPTPTPEQLLTDPQFRSQLMGNEQFRNEIISQYMQNRTNTNQQVPPVMGSQPGGNATAIPEARPTTLKEASKMFAKSLGL